MNKQNGLVNYYQPKLNPGQIVVISKKKNFKRFCIYMKEWNILFFILNIELDNKEIAYKGIKSEDIRRKYLESRKEIVSQFKKVLLF